MAVLLNSVSPIKNPSQENARKPCGFFSPIPNLHSFSLTMGFSKVLASTQMAISPKETVFTMPNWSSGRNDPRTRDLRLNDAFLYLEYMVGEGHKPDVDHATQLLYDLCKLNKLRKATRVMEMMVNSGCSPDPSTYNFLVDHLCRRGNVGYAMQLVEKMEECGYPTNTVTNNSLVKGLCIL
ncbi:Pentatricopeptide repeat-containing protein [Camellia lanceoleosa]|uniref:Pentatricopeptide repeat-containing protein n=1 Tax=Camellia lanceoleosa TaxID=1840588 RepID=A0ACC0H2E1_9ERIC|nr:Pentatricopeptide repeat-containing protein [Camellia lanceoleosa]